MNSSFLFFFLFLVLLGDIRWYLQRRWIDSLYKSKKVWFVLLQPGSFQEESLFFCPVALCIMTTVVCEFTFHFCLMSCESALGHILGKRSMGTAAFLLLFGALEALVLKPECCSRL